MNIAASSLNASFPVLNNYISLFFKVGIHCNNSSLQVNFKDDGQKIIKGQSSLKIYDIPIA
jgi:hypothetical protein